MLTAFGNDCRSSEVNIVKDFSKKTYSGCFTSRTFLTLWIVMLCLSTAGCCQRVWKKYEESPTTLSFGNNTKSLSEKQFPAVTIRIDSGLDKALVDYLENTSSAHGRKTLKWRQDKNETFSNNWNLENGYQLPEDDTTPVVICNASEQCFGNVKSSCGGVLCLLLSFTVLSLVEEMRDINKSIPEWVHKLKEKAKEKRKVNLVESYLENSSLHGVKYIVLRRAKWYQKAFWIVMLCLSTAGCSQQMYRVWKKWEESPIILSFGNDMKSLSEIPFPAVTICIDSGLNKAIVDYSKNITSAHERKKLQHLAQLTCGISDKKNDSPETFNVSEVVDFLKLVSAPLDMSVADCKYRTVTQDCKKLFSPVLIDRGLCYTFNGLANDEIFREGVKTIKWWEDKNETFSNKWDLETGYQLPENDNHALESLYPFVALDVGADFGLNIKTISTLLYMVNNCPKVANGFKIILHNPVEFPHARRISYRSNVNADVSIFVRPEYITTPDVPVLNIALNRRQCYFSNERQLKYFRYYTQDNCAVECLTDNTLDQCNCVAFYMPTTSPVPICSATNQCFRNVTKLMVKNQIEKTVCNCLPACTELSYTVENSHTYSSETTAKSSISNNTGSVNVIFTEAYFITKERKELFGKTEFLSSCGGTLGLFLGFSVLSLVEVIYYISLYFSNKRRILLSQASSMASIDFTQVKRRQTL